MTKSWPRSGSAVSAWIAAAWGTLACSGPPSGDVFRITTPPPPPAFDTVSIALELHCGTLNCHGNSARNMRFFGFYGTRLNPKDQPGFAPETTPDEIQANFESIISIEPEKLSQIVLSNGANEGKWIVLSKGRGTEHHKGGTRMVPGDAMDTCLTSWITAHGVADGGANGLGPGLVNVQACQAASEYLPPGADWTTPQ